MNIFNEYLSVATDDTLNETRTHGSDDYSFAYYLEDIWQFDFHCIDWHWHHELEFISVAKGTVLCYVGTDKIELREGEGLFVNSGNLHRYEAADSTIFPNIVFSPFLLAPEGSLIYEKYIRPVIYSSVSYQIFSPGTEWQDEILRILSAIYDLQLCDEKKELHTVQLLLKIWDILFSHVEILKSLGDNLHPDHRQARLQIMMQYVHDHYREEITLKEIAASASVSKSSALQIFQSGIGISPVAYLIQYRLARAARMLLTTEKSVSNIAEETGFSTPGYFCRKFKERYQMSPNMYRKK